MMTRPWFPDFKIKKFNLDMSMTTLYEGVLSSIHPGPRSSPVSTIYLVPRFARETVKTYDMQPRQGCSRNRRETRRYKSEIQSTKWHDFAAAARYDEV